MTPTYPHKGFNPKIMMSYYHNCTAIFTTDQQNRMKDKILNHINDSHFDLPVEDLIIHDSLVLMTPYQAAANIIIENGGVLVISSTLYMPEKAKIIIEAGGILSVNGGTITKGKFKDLCHERTGDPRFWYGIEMQFSTGGTPPKFVCINGTIEYSEKGVHNPTSKNAGNGTIKIYNSSFKNNKASIFIERAPSFSTPISVNKTRFYLDSSFSLSNYYTQIHIDNSKIYLDSCIFDNPDYLQPLTESAYAIRSMNTDLGIQHSNFKDSIYGVQCLSHMSKATLGITKTSFTKNRIGVNATVGVNNYSITKDTFDSTVKIGLLSDQCSGYIINNNHFRRPGGTATDSTGIQMNNSTIAGNLIQKNVYTSVKHGNVMNGTNGDVPNQKGLQLYCNEYYGINNHDNVLNGPISGIQGEVVKATGNIAGDNEVDHLISFLPNNDIMVYYFKSGLPQHTADSDPKYRMKREPVSNYNCSALIGRPDTVSHFVLYKRYEDTLNTKNNKYIDSIDGGNTSTLLSYISGVTSGSAATFLYNQLINKSPWLSSTVVLAAYNRSDVFDSTKRAEIIYHNPDPLRSGEFKSELRNADVPLATSSLDALDTLTLYTTIRTNLESEIASLTLRKNVVCYDILNELKMDTIDQNDSILVWLHRAGDYSSQREIMETHFGNGDFIDASTALSDLEELNELEESQTSDLEGLNILLGFLIAIREDERYEGNLSEEEIEWMIEFATENENQVGNEVRSALEFYYGILPENEGALRTYIDQSKKGKIGKAIKPIVENEISENVLIYPNPSNNEIIIQMPNNYKSIWDIDIMDLNGKRLTTSSSNSNSFKIDLSKIPIGIILISFSNDRGEKFIKRVQIMK